MIEKFTWDDVSIGQYDRLMSISSTKMNDLDKAISMLSVLTGEIEDHYKEMPLPRLKEHLKMIEGLNHEELKPHFESGKYEVAGVKYNLTPNAEKMTAGQFIDYQSTAESNPEDLSMFMAILCVPEGKKYGEGYDVMELRQTFYEKFPYTHAMGVCFFFQKTSSALLTSFLSYLTRKIKRTKKKESDQIAKKIERATSLISGIR